MPRRVRGHTEEDCELKTRAKGADNVPSISPALSRGTAPPPPGPRVFVAKTSAVHCCGSADLQVVIFTRGAKDVPPPLSLQSPAAELSPRGVCTTAASTPGPAENAMQSTLSQSFSRRVPSISRCLRPCKHVPRRCHIRAHVPPPAHPTPVEGSSTCGGLIATLVDGANVSSPDPAISIALEAPTHGCAHHPVPGPRRTHGACKRMPRTSE